MNEFLQEVNQVFGFLTTLGFRFGRHDELSGYAGAETATFYSDRVGVLVGCDHRGEVDIELTLLNSDPKGPIPRYQLHRFGPSSDPFAFSPPATFSRIGGTSMKRALELLADYMRAYAADALQGEPAAFARASRWEPPRKVLP